jgi:hypothetical protein
MSKGNTMLKITCATAALVALANPALAGTCANPAEAAALKTAAMQQELMVAALQCHEANAYNRFVMSYRAELQDSDATLKSFFVRRGGEHGEAGYDTFKTKAANLSALEQARDSHNFCADAHALFTAAMENRGSLASFVDAKASDIGSVCTESRPVMMAAADQPPIAAPTKAVAVVRIAAVEGAKSDMKSDVKPDVKMAKADVVAVPDHATPALPWRHEDVAPVRSARADDRGDYNDDGDDARPAYATADEDDLPPPRPRAMPIRDREEDGYYGNAPYADRRADDRYGPPPSWYSQTAYGQPRPYRWTPPPGYYNW